MSDQTVTTTEPITDAPAKVTRTRKATGGGKAPQAFYNAPTLAEAARAIGITDGKAFRNRVRSLVGHVSRTNGGMGKLWTRANANKVLGDASIVRMRANVKASKKASK